MSETMYKPNEDERLSETIVRGISVTSNTPPEEIQPLYESIDPEGLNKLFDGRGAGGYLEFDHAGYQVTVKRSGNITLTEES